MPSLSRRRRRDHGERVETRREEKGRWRCAGSRREEKGRWRCAGSRREEKGRWRCAGSRTGRRRRDPERPRWSVGGGAAASRSALGRWVAARRVVHSTWCIPGAGTVLRGATPAPPPLLVSSAPTPSSPSPRGFHCSRRAELEVASSACIRHDVVYVPSSTLHYRGCLMPPRPSTPAGLQEF